MPNGLRERENVANMDSSHPMLRSYADAVQMMKDLPTSDPRNWERQAEIHQNFCPHGNWYFLPWHRAYVLAFEEICRDLSGNPQFALPYWNWTRSRRIPGPFWQGTLLDTTREVDQNERIPAQFVRQRIIDNILRQTDFELFASTRPFGQNNTDQRWQRAGGAESLLERTPHDNVHIWAGGNMRTFMSPLDPIFWLHHCNIDRLWAEWNTPPRSNQNTSDALWTDFAFRQNFVDQNGTAFDVVVRDLQDLTQLGYTYDTLPQPQPAQPSPLPPLLDRARKRFELMEPRAASLGQEVSFAVETPESAVPLAAEAVWVEDVAADDAPKVLAFVRGVEPPEDPRVTVNVFLNCPYLSAETPVSDPHYVGNFTFFGVHEHDAEGDHDMSEHDMKKSFCFDLSEAVDRVQALEPDLESRLTLQLLPVPFEGRDVPPEEIRIEGVEIVYI